MKELKVRCFDDDELKAAIKARHIIVQEYIESLKRVIDVANENIRLAIQKINKLSAPSPITKE